MKSCKTCKLPKDLTEFAKNLSMKDHYLNECKSCHNKLAKLPEYRAKMRLLMDRYKDKKPEVIMCQVKSTAKKYGLEFNLEISDIVIPDKCPILGISLFRTKGKRTDNTPSVDRVDNSKGYIKGNISIISWRANQLKRDATLDELKRLVEYVSKYC